jgi:membrane fusion protein (multidrug efflux system)
MKRNLFFLGIAIIIVIFTLLKMLVFSDNQEQKTAAVANPAILVECYIAKDTSVNYQLETVGTIRANEQVEIVGEINKKITAIYLKEGASVVKDQLLFKLDDADVNARINKLVVEEKLSAANESREKVLLDKGGISQERFDVVSNLRQTLQAEIEVLKVDLAKTEIRAPFAGRIGLRNVSEGTLVNPELVLANLVDVSRMKIDFSIPERYAQDLHVGSKISFHTDYLENEVSAVVEAIEPAVDIKTRTLLVRAVAANGDGKLVAGTSARVAMTLMEFDKSLFIPTSALIPSSRGYGVFVNRSGSAQPLMVKTGVRNRDYIQILDGLRPGDTIVMTNLLRIKKESPLKIIKIS